MLKNKEESVLHGLRNHHPCKANQRCKILVVKYNKQMIIEGACENTHTEGGKTKIQMILLFSFVKQIVQT